MVALDADGRCPRRVRRAVHDFSIAADDAEVGLAVREYELVRVFGEPHGSWAAYLERGQR